MRVSKATLKCRDSVLGIELVGDNEGGNVYGIQCTGQENSEQGQQWMDSLKQTYSCQDRVKI